MCDTTDDIYVPTLKLENNEDLLTKIDTERIEALKASFQKEYLIEPKYIVRVPGRVNIIGEHIDYCGYPVLPMAIEQCILLAIAPSTDDVLYLKNVDQKYREFKVSVNEIKIEPSIDGAPEWYDYFLCGIKGILDHLGHSKGMGRGMMALVNGNIPPSAGLSSSSALVCSAVLSTAYLHDIPLNKQLLATIAAKCERYIGTQGGGMDQAIAFLAIPGTAQYIEWNPLTATPTRLPPNAIFVIANSLAKINKAATHDFNQRVVECRLGCKLLAKKLNQPWRDIDRFHTLQTQLNCTLEQMIKFADTLLPQSTYTRKELLNAFNIMENDFTENLLSYDTRHLQEFKLRQRTLHVFQEAQRVEKFRETAINTNSIDTLAQLMNDSHTSLDTQYECSHENLNKLVKIGHECGVGVRLTGAGWGGCVVALCNSIASCEKFMNALKQQYYSQLNDGKMMNDLSNILFKTNPQRGALILIL